MALESMLSLRSASDYGHIDDLSVDLALSPIEILTIFFLTVMFVVGTVGNVLCIVTLQRNDAMLAFPVYFAIRLIAIGDTVVLWMLCIRLGVETAFSFDAFATSPWTCRVTTFVGWAVSQFVYWLLIVLSCGNCLATCCCATRRHHQCCIAPMVWTWVTVIALPCICTALTLAWDADIKTSQCVIILQRASISENMLMYLLPFLCFSNIFVAVLLVIIIVQTVWCRKQHQQQGRLRGGQQNAFQSPTPRITTRVFVADLDADVSIVRGVGADMAIITLLVTVVYIDASSCLAGFFADKTRTVPGYFSDNSFSVKIPIFLRCIIILFYSFKFFLYLIVMPEFRSQAFVTFTSSVCLRSSNIPTTHDF